MIPNDEAAPEWVVKTRPLQVFFSAANALQPARIASCCTLKALGAAK